MADFIAANPGFKSRVAFNFNFPDYTCALLGDGQKSRSLVAGFLLDKISFSCYEFIPSMQVLAHTYCSILFSKDPAAGMF